MAANNPFATAGGAAATGNPWIAGGAVALDTLGGLFGEDEQAGLQRRMMKLNEQKWAEGQPLRAMGLSRLQGALPERPDLGADFADPSNPFAKAPAAIGFGSGYSNQPPDLQESLGAYRALALGPYGQESSEQQAQEAAGPRTFVGAGRKFQGNRNAVGVGGGRKQVGKRGF